jgi:hypothetical protein
MPPRWPRQPDRRDADFRQLDDRMNFALHGAVFAASNSGLWFFKTLQRADWSWASTVTLGWMGLVALHALYIFKLADYSEDS